MSTRNVIVTIFVRHLHNHPSVVAMTEQEYALLLRDAGRLVDLRWYPDARTGRDVRVEVKHVVSIQRWPTVRRAS